MSPTPDHDEKQISRRDLLRGRFLGGLVGLAADFAMDRVHAVASWGGLMDPKEDDEVVIPDRRKVSPGTTFTTPAGPAHRPPGAVAEVDFIDGCTKCNACIEVCPAGAIIHASFLHGSAAGMPIIEPESQPCVMCTELACMHVCEPGVLLPTLPVKMGTAVIIDHDCLAHHGSICTKCTDHCPVPNAIHIENNRPVVNEPACTGCGVCLDICPTTPKAIRIEIVHGRPLKPGKPIPRSRSGLQ